MAATGTSFFLELVFSCKTVSLLVSPPIKFFFPSLVSHVPVQLEVPLRDEPSVRGDFFLAGQAGVRRAFFFSPNAPISLGFFGRSPGRSFFRSCRIVPFFETQLLFQTLLGVRGSFSSTHRVRGAARSPFFSFFFLFAKEFAFIICQLD